MIPSSGCPLWRPDHPRTLPRTGNPTPPHGTRPLFRKAPPERGWGLNRDERLGALQFGLARTRKTPFGSTTYFWWEPCGCLAVERQLVTLIRVWPLLSNADKEKPLLNSSALRCCSKRLDLSITIPVSQIVRFRAY